MPHGECAAAIVLAGQPGRRQALELAGKVLVHKKQIHTMKWWGGAKQDMANRDGMPQKAQQTRRAPTVTTATPAASAVAAPMRQAALSPDAAQG